MARRATRVRYAAEALPELTRGLFPRKERSSRAQGTGDASQCGELERKSCMGFQMFSTSQLAYRCEAFISPMQNKNNRQLCTVVL